MHNKTYIFAGGGTGGHIYPGIAVAEKIKQLDPSSIIHFCVSDRDIDSYILKKTSFDFTILPASPFAVHPVKFAKFLKTFQQSQKIANDLIAKSNDPAIIGIGGFAAAPVCRAAYKHNTPVFLINTDIVPGKANKLIARWADKIFVQFDYTKNLFKKYSSKVDVTGAPLRNTFENPNPKNAIEQLNLDATKKILLITGASSGSQNINNAICKILPDLEKFKATWQIVHITGLNNYKQVSDIYSTSKIKHATIDYCEDMAPLLAASDLLIGRSGAVSVAEYAASKTPAICIPYPYHRDNHQYLNAKQLADANAALIVKDTPETAENLLATLEKLMANETKLHEMKNNYNSIAKNNASIIISEIIINKK